ncbi:MAG: hypothetical protein KDK36_02645, partial [Leptospiraceae bacterium]|nr:hypothetical protein [Leptospiraceae bacterium]
MRFLLLPFLLISFSIYSQNAKLGEKEIQDVEAVKFKNKTTKRAAEETKALHEAIGKKLADMALENPDSIQSYKGVKVVRVSSDSKSKFSADIIYLDNSTRFGHIHSIQRILSGYIQNAFEYNEDKADILATYVIYYNAMHRGGVKYIKSKYSDEIIKRTSKSYLGISVNYKNWPGKTEI